MVQSFQSDNSLRYVRFPFTRVSEYVFFGVSRGISRIRKPKRTQALMAVGADLRQYNGARLHPGTGGPVLLLSMRKLADLVAYSLAYEFEDTVAELTGADRVDAGDWDALEFSRRAYKLTRFATGSRKMAARFAPKPSTVGLTRDYELFFPAFSHIHELYSLATIPDWRKRCRVAVCFITESWPNRLPGGYLLELLSEFDHVFIGHQHCVDDVARIVGKPCTYLPLASNVLRFAPTPEALHARPIDVCNIGRRSQVTHAALLKLADARKIFYYYDTVAASGAGNKHRSFRTDNPSEHRRLLASLLQRSCYYIANRSRVNDPEFTRGVDEISSQFYEGAAAGTVMIGVPPKNAEFAGQFDWQDAVIHLPFDSPEVGQILAELNSNPQRLAAIRRNNVHYAALRHDWGTRLRTIFDTVGIKPTDAMLAREDKLKTLAARILEA